ncbi:MAG: diacylglycerol kinase family protein [Planctomycetota bacterium]
MTTSGDDMLVLHNPGSRSGVRVANKLRELAASMSPAPALDWVPFAELRAIERAPRRLIAVGGDGTVNYAATWLRGFAGTSELGIVPAGTGNNLARGLGIPLDPEVAFRAAVMNQTTRLVDTVVVRADDDEREHLMLQSGALGFPAQVAHRYDALRKNRLLRAAFVPAGPYIYRILSGAGLASHAWRRSPRGRAQTTKITVDGNSYEEDCFALFLGNERSLGGNFIPCPQAVLDDGLVDICVVRELPVRRYPSLFRKVARGTHVELTDEVLYLQGKSVTITLPQASPLLIDGDLLASTASYTLHVLPRTIALVSAQESGSHL